LNSQDLHIHSPLVDECRKGNRKAQFRLYSLYSKAMFNVAHRMMNNREDAEDILQESFTDCFRNLDKYRYDSSFGAWLKTIVVNNCINKLRKKDSVLLFLEDLTPFEKEEETIIENEKWPDPEKIIRAVEQLPDGYRVVFSLYLLEGYDHAEISRILKISESTSKTQYLRAKEKLKKILLTS